MCLCRHSLIRTYVSEIPTKHLMAYVKHSPMKDSCSLRDLDLNVYEMYQIFFSDVYRFVGGNTYDRDMQWMT